MPRDPTVRRAIPVFGAVCVGFLLSRAAPGVEAPVWLGACALAQLPFVLARRPAVRRGSLLIGAMLLSGAWHHARLHDTHPRALDHLLRAHHAREVVVRVDGQLLGAPEVMPAPAGALASFSPGSRRPSTSAMFRVGRVEQADGWHPARGTLRLFIRGPTPLEAGDHAIVAGRFRSVRPATNPGSPDRAALAAQAGLVGTLAVPDPALLVRRAPSGVSEGVQRVTRRALHGLRAGARAALDRPASPEAQAIRNAILLGERDPTFAQLADAFAHAGLLHLLAISGLHVGLLMLGVRTMVMLTGDRARTAHALSTGVLLVYLLLVPARPPVLRAAGVLLVLTNAHALARRYDPLNTLAWVGVVLLIHRPADLWSLGFQLSLGVTAMLIHAADRTHDRLFGPTLRGGLDPVRTARRQALHDVGGLLGRAFRRTTGAGVLAYCGSLPLVMARTGVIGPMAVPAGLLALPLVSVLLWCGFGAMLLHPIGPWLAGPLADLTGVLGGALDAIARAAARVRGVFPGAPPMPAAWVVLSVTGVLCWLHPARRRRRIGLVLLGMSGVWLVARSVSPEAPARFDLFDVGDGTCLLIRAAGPGSGAVLWDAGSMRPSIGVRELPAALHAVGATRVPYAIVTHANLDHFSALPDLAPHIRLETVFVTARVHRQAKERPGSAAHALLVELRGAGVRVAHLGAGDRLKLGHATLRILAPDPDHDYRTENDASLVGRLDVPTGGGTRCALLTGDLQTEGIARLLEHPQLPTRVAVLELPHHGSHTPITGELLARTEPAVVLQSTGPRRLRADPWSAERSRALWCTTALDGSAHLRIDQAGVTSRRRVGR